MSAALLTVCCLLSANVASYRFDSWTAESGLPQNSVHDVRQTRDGYLWLTTAAGLVRFDGVTFTVFDRSTSPGIGSSRGTDLLEGPDGTLWIGTDDGGVIRYRDGRFSTHQLTGGWVGALALGPDGAPLATSDGRLFRWDGAAFRPDGAAPLAGRTTVRSGGGSLREWGGPGGLWAMDDDYLTIQRGSKRLRLGLADGMPSLDVSGAVLDGRGVYWLATTAGLVRYVEGRPPQVLAAPDLLPSHRMALVSGPRTRLLVLEPGGGLVLIDTETLHRERLPPAPPEIREMLEMTDRAYRYPLYEDREGNIWIGTDGHGLFRLRPQVVTTLSRAQGLLQRNVYPVLQDRRGDVWIGTWPGALSRIRDGQVRNFTQADGLNGSEITSLYEDRGGRLWVASYGLGGLRVLEGERFVPVSERLGLRDIDVISAMYEDPEGALWIGTDRRLLRLQGTRLQAFTVEDGLTSNNIKALIAAAGGGIWIGTAGGLNRYRGGRFTGYSEADGLPGGAIRALYEDRQGALWIGSYDGGMGRLKDGRLTRYSVSEGLFNNGVFQLLEDDAGNLWMGSNRGISRVSKRELDEVAEGRRREVTAVPYGKADGMLNVECNGGRWPAGLRDKDGRLWFPTQDGVAVVDPARAAPRPFVPPVKIESFLLDRRALPFADGATVPPGRDSFEIVYTALSFAAPELVRFRYRMEGLDRDWIDADGRRSAYYSRVPPGAYTFRVLAASREGVWNERGASLRVVVLAAPSPLRKLALFGGGLVLALAAALLLLRLRAARADRASRESFARALIDSQERERRRIAADLHDSLGQILFSIRNRAFLALGVSGESSPAVQAHLQEISSHVSLALKEARAIAYNLRPYQLERAGLARTLEETFAQLEAADISTSVQIAPIDDLLSDEAEMGCFRIVQEGIDNILKHARASHAWLRVRRQDHAVEIEIGDDGVGLPAERGRRLSRDSGHGMGLLNIRERVRLLGGTFAFESTAGQGTILRVLLPAPARPR